RLERARASALGSRDISGLGELLLLAREARYGAGIEPRAGDVVYAIEQNIRYLERRLGAPPTPIDSPPSPPPADAASAQPTLRELDVRSRAARARGDAPELRRIAAL